MANDPTWDDIAEETPTWADVVEEPKPSIVKSSIARAAADRFGAGPGPVGPAPKFSESLLGISPEMIPSGANTRVPWLTIPASVAGKTAAGLAGYATSPQGIGEITTAATPAAPAILAKWAYDMVRGGYDNVKGIVQELGGMAREALNRGIINANNLGPIPEGQTLQDHIQSLSEKAANAALVGAGALGVASHIKLPTREIKAVPEPTSEVPEQEVPPAVTVGTPATEAAPVAAKEGAAAAVPSPQAKAEPTPIRKTTQEPIVTPPVTHNTVKDAWVGYDEEGTIETPRDLANIIEGLHGEGKVPAYVMRALQRYRTAIEEDFTKYAGRGDVEGPEEKFLSAVEKAASAKPRNPKGAAVTPPGQGPEMGAAGIKEIPETGAGGEKYGVAERVRTERAQAGQVEPVEPGQGISTQKTIEMGRDIIRRDPEAGNRIMEAFEADPQKKTSTTGMAVVRAHGEALAAGARTIEETYGTESPEYKAAKNFLSDWDRRSKAMQTEWHGQGQAQQGETDIDTGSFTGLQRARQQATGGKDIPPSEVPRAKRIAKQNKDAQDKVNEASAAIKTQIRKQNPKDAEKAALDAASERVRLAAAKLADDENKARVAQAQRDKEAANIQVKNSKKALDAAKKVEEQVRNRAIKEAQRRATDPSIAVWEQANKYLDENKGIYSFDDIRNKVAVDLKMPVSKVTSIMAQDSTTKRLATDFWIKQRNARRLKEQAKIWLRELDTPGYEKALRSLPNFMFSLAVGGHGLVALGTHAPIVAFQPRFWGAYVKNFGRMYKMVFNPAYYEQQMQDLVRRSHQEEIRGQTVTVNDWELARNAGLQNDPFKYEEFQTTFLRDMITDWIGQKNMDRVDKFLGAGNRGYSVLKVLRQDMWDQKYSNLPRSIRIQEGVPEALADGINHTTGVTKKVGHPAANLALFAPRLAASRFMWLVGDPATAAWKNLNWDKASTADKRFAIEQLKEKAWVFGTFASLLAANQGFLAATGSKQKINGIPEALGGAGIDPLSGDFLKFKVAGANVAYGGALLTLCKLPVRMGYAIYFEGKGSKYVLEEERFDKVFMGYLRTQASPFAGTVADTLFGRDFEERPLPSKLFGTVEQTGAVPKRLQMQGVDEAYTWPEYATTHLPIPLAEALREGFKGSGMPDEQIDYWTKAFGIGIIMLGTGTRITEDTREE